MGTEIEVSVADGTKWRGIADIASGFFPDLRSQMWDYYWSIVSANTDEPPADKSLVVRSRDGFAIAVLPMIEQGGVFSYFGQPAEALFNCNCDAVQVDVAARALREHLLELAEQTGAIIKWFDAAPASGSQWLPNWQEKLLSAGARTAFVYRGAVDLGLREAGLKRSLRKSFKSLVNWGRREMEIAFHSGTSADFGVFEEFRLFHARIAGRVTRPRQSWDEMYKLAVENRGFLCTGLLDGEMVAATYVFHDTSSALYGTGVYERDLFEKPISHWPIYASIVKCMEMGLEHFDLGEVFLPADASEKEKSIGFFKKGFSQYTTSRCVWTLGQ
ncbi:MAG: hypothetical protein R3D34_05805 [Nitratireductor sp.]